MINQIEKKDICVNGVSIACYCAGDSSDTILLLHGAGVDSAMLSWAEVIPLLSNGYQVIAPDLPGYGASSRIDGEYTLSFYTEIVTPDRIESIDWIRFCYTVNYSDGKNTQFLEGNGN